MTETERNQIQKMAREWVQSVYDSLKEGQRDWVGVYWKESFLYPEKSQSTDLIVGPYIGPETPHVRIPESEGLCGLAVREERTVNVADVTADERFLACSTTTKSEIIIPIRDLKGEIVGELDIDSNFFDSFDAATQSHLEALAQKLTRLLFSY
jgi:L-methionine (R)-S-oxide reductase